MSEPETNTCACGQPKPVQLLQCKACRVASIKKIAKYGVIIGALLGLLCQHLPEGYHAACKTVAGALSSC